jgi:hypothetical protein
MKTTNQTWKKLIYILAAFVILLRTFFLDSLEEPYYEILSIAGKIAWLIFFFMVFQMYFGNKKERN